MRRRFFRAGALPALYSLLLCALLLSACPQGLGPGGEEPGTGDPAGEFDGPPPPVRGGKGKLSVTWTALPGAAAYELWYDMDDNFEGALLFSDTVESPALSAEITGLEDGAAYWVWVKPKNAAGEAGAPVFLGGDRTPRLDPRLLGRWQSPWGEVDDISGDPEQDPEALGFFSHDGGYTFIARGDIVWAEDFDGANGVIILKYRDAESRMKWYSLGNEPSDRGDYMYFYYLELEGDGSPGTSCKIFQTSDQRNGYGPTEQKTFAAARRAFTRENLERWIAVNIGGPTEKKSL